MKSNIKGVDLDNYKHGSIMQCFKLEELSLQEANTITGGWSPSMQGGLHVIAIIGAICAIHFFAKILQTL